VVGRIFSSLSSGRLADIATGGHQPGVGDQRLAFRRQHIVNEGFGIVSMLAWF
jgi:hypothetical protein